MNDIEAYLNNMSQWFRDNNFIGYDPYQLKLNRYRFLVARKISTSLATYGLKKLFIPKAIGLIIRGNVSRYKVAGDKRLLAENQELIQSLLIHRYSSYSNPAWGWPFRWTSGLGLTYPEHYPLSVVTAEIGHAFLDQYEVNPSPIQKNVCQQIADALINKIGFNKINSDHVCFYYTALDKYHVINCSTYVAAFLARMHSITPNEEYNSLSSKACKFALACQQRDGSWFYYAPPFDERNQTIDNRHTGFAIVSLLCANRYLNDPELEECISKGWTYYRQNFVGGCKPKNRTDSLYPIDMHNVSQLIITATEMNDFQLANDCAMWAIQEMSNRENEFYYQMYENGTKIRVPFFRWNQAWMYRALSLMLEASYVRGV